MEKSTEKCGTESLFTWAESDSRWPRMMLPWLGHDAETDLSECSAVNQYLYMECLSHTYFIKCIGPYNICDLSQWQNHLPLLVFLFFFSWMNRMFGVFLVVVALLIWLSAQTYTMVEPIGYVEPEHVKLGAVRVGNIWFLVTHALL